MLKVCYGIEFLGISQLHAYMFFFSRIWQFSVLLLICFNFITDDETSWGTQTTGHFAKRQNNVLWVVVHFSCISFESKVRQVNQTCLQFYFVAWTILLNSLISSIYRLGQDQCPKYVALWWKNKVSWILFKIISTEHNILQANSLKNILHFYQIIKKVSLIIYTLLDRLGYGLYIHKHNI